MTIPPCACATISKPNNPGRRRLRDPLLFAILILLVLDVASRFSVATPLVRTNVGTVDCRSQQQYQSSPSPSSLATNFDDAFNNTYLYQDASCGVAWSLPGLMKGQRTTYSTVSTTTSSSTSSSSRIPPAPKASLLVKSSTMIHTTTWSHQRSGAPSATGTISAQISYCSNRCDDETSAPQSNCTTGTNSSTSTSATSTTTIVRKETVLCGGGGDRTEDLQRSDRRTVVVEFGGSWDDLLGDANLNMWHFHAAVFRIWAGVQIGQSLSMVQPAQPLPPQTMTSGKTTVILHVPSHVFDRFQYRRGPVLVASPASLFEHLLSLGNAIAPSTKTHLEGLQGVADVFQGRLLVTQSGVTTVSELQAALSEQGAYPLVSQWIQPPNDGLLWDLAWDKRLRNTLSTDCRNSLLHLYRNDILGGLAFSHGSDIQKRPPNQHVCFISRQRRNKKGTPSRGSLRNLSPEFLLELLGNLGSPILLTPSTALRQPDNVVSGRMSTRLIQMEKISIAEQIQYVYEECAVLVSVHGAGLINALGMRPGTAVIEFQSNANRGYQYFANVAALMNQVSYTLVDTLDGDGPDHEQNMHASNERDMERIYALVEKNLQESFQRQVELQR